jgi:TRAP-type uncharacterized transport system substrate-binding protein
MSKLRIKILRWALMNHLLPGWVRPLIFSLGIVTLTAAAIWLAFALLRPTPPRTVAMATDPEGSLNAELAKRYQQLLARDGIDLKLAPSAGAVESVARLRDPKSDISIAIIPSGVTNQRQSPELVTLGTLFYEPLWVFSRGRPLQKHERLRGLRISIGPEGSGSHALSIEFLARVGIIDRKSATLLSLTPSESAQKMILGEIDVAVLLDAWESPVVHELLTTQDVNLESLSRADAFVALYPYLTKLVLPAGVDDLAENRPPTDVLLLASKASLVVRNDLHPAIQYLLLNAATQIHSPPGLFHTAGQFPAPESVDLPLNTQARQFYKTGSPFLQRHLPFWLAVLVQQLLVLLIPLLAVLYPLLRFAPAIYGWAERRRVYRLYSELKRLEDELVSAVPASSCRDFVERLTQLENRASRLSVPASIQPLLYDLRWHIEIVRQQVQKSIAL